MIALFLWSLIIPAQESFTYETNDKGKIGKIEVTQYKDSLGFHVGYVSDRTIEVMIDTFDFRTLSVRKIVKGKQELSIEKGKSFMVNYRGRKTAYHETGPIYDRHTLDYVLRGFVYSDTFKRRIRLNVPEFMIINADLTVYGSEEVSTPIGIFECWKIMMIPRVIFTKMKFYFWIEKEYPHRFVKYADSSGKNQILIIKYEFKD